MTTGVDTTIQRSHEEEISELICNVLFFCTHANSKSIKMHKNMILVQDFMCNIRFLGKLSRHCVGSKGEGTAIEESDSDDLYIWKRIMLCKHAVQKAFIWGKIIIGESEDVTNEQNCIVFVLDSAECRQGYTKLKLIINDKIKKDALNKNVKTIMDMVEKTPKGFYLSNRKVIDLFSEILNSTNVPLNVFRHGPCATAIFESRYDYKNEALHDQDHDHAQGFEIRLMTKEGEDWLAMMDASRKERHWPSPKTIEKIRALKCEVVAVGGHDPNFPDFSLKWRISYTLWERELVWSFQDVQLHCYVFLKILLKRRLKIISDDLTSFHMKNVVFWESVGSSREMLQSKTNFLALVKKCLIRLREAIHKKRLEHFIDRNRNLFESKLTDERVNLALINYLDKEVIMSNNIVPVAFECIGRDNLKALWYSCGSEPAKFLSRTHFHDEYARVGNNQELRRLQELFTYGVAVSEIKSEVLFDASDEMINKYIEKFDILEKMDIENEYVGLTKTIMLFHYKLFSAARSFVTDKDWNEYICYRKARFTDALSDRLYLSTCLVRYCRFSEAEIILDEFSNASQKLYMYCGQCSDCFGIAVNEGEVTYVKEASLDVTDDQFPFVYDILINNIRTDFPPAIRIQVSLENYLYLNPVVYMYYLKVMCDVNANRNVDRSLQKLAYSVHQCGLERDNFRHLNLLGHAYILTKRYLDAYGCLLESIRDNVSRNIPNSVFYLLLILIHQILNFGSDNKFPDISVLYSR